jgi:sirohydrochlorin ferrochelatase
MSTTGPSVILLDNGSLEPAATLSLRKIAAALSQASGLPIHPVSLLHSHKVPAEKLENEAASILEPFLKRAYLEGRFNFIIIPLFFGPSGALTEYLPERIALLKEKYTDLKVEIKPCLAGYHGEDKEALASILEENIEEALGDHRGRFNLILTDHGSPKKEVTNLRNELAALLGKRFGNRAQLVSPASMERRPEPEYDFNEPLLETALSQEGFQHGLTVVSLLFFSPGRHAGPGGDIEQICAAAKTQHPSLQIVCTPLVGSHPGLIELLKKKLEAS